MEKHVSQSMIEQVYRLRPEHLNGGGRLFGGQLMAWIDEAAGLAAIRHAHADVVTASVEHLEFLRGAAQYDLVVLIARLVWVGRSSMEVRVDSFVEHLDGSRELITRAYLTLVSIDAEGHSRPVPGLIPDTEEERAEYEAAAARRARRKAQNRKNV